MTASTPLVSCLLAAHDAAETVGVAVGSLLRQTLADIEVIVVDDCSADATAEVLAGLADQRLAVVRNGSRLGLAGSLNRGLDLARGRWVARLDADDVAMPARLERQLAAANARPSLALLGSAALELEDGVPTRLHEQVAGDDAVRWRLHFSCPFFHPSVLVDRELLDREALRYDASYLESEDYDLWARLLERADGDNLASPLLLKRVHASQATQRNRPTQRAFQRQVALREVLRTAPHLGVDGAELAWQLGAGELAAETDVREAVDAFVDLYHAFRRFRRGRASADVAARQLARASVHVPSAARADVLRAALRIEPGLPLAYATRRRRLRRAAGPARAAAAAWLRELEGSGRPLRVVVVSPEPTPYRAPLLDLVAARQEIDLTVAYTARTVAGRQWSVEPRHRAVFLRGLRIPGAARVLRHDYPVTPGVLALLASTRPDVVVVSGWSTFASQAALAWARMQRVPYALLVSSHERGERTGWRRALRRLVVPRLVRGAAGALVLGSLSRESLVANGADPRRVHVFANTVDVAAWGRRADELAPRRAELRAALGAGPDDVVVLSVARLAPEKGLDTLLCAVASIEERRPCVVVVGGGPEQRRLERLAADVDVRLVLAGEVERPRLQELYAAADVFALLSRWEPWGVVVNEAAAFGLPLVLSDQVGAAPDLLRDGDNGVLVPAGDVTAAGAALRRLSGDALFRRAAGARSRELVQAWGYEPSVESFVQAVRDAATR